MKKKMILLLFLLMVGFVTLSVSGCAVRGGFFGPQPSYGPPPPQPSPPPPPPPGPQSSGPSFQGQVYP
jgi:hypothetical protein